MKKGEWIYWRWKKDGKCFSKSKIQAIIKTEKNGDLLELGEEIWSSFPNRVLVKEIDIL